jgi:putative ABC transport system permease protein
MRLPAIGGAARSAEVEVAGIWRDYARQHGAIAIGSEDYTRLTGNALRTNAAVELAAGAEAADVTSRLRAALPPTLRPQVGITEPGAIRALSLRIFDRSFAVTYLLEAVAILVGLAGVAATFSAQTLARTKEFGMLRHIGVMRRQVVAMLAAEGALLGTIGVVAGIGLGVAMSQVLIHVVNPQSFNWTMDTRLPWPLFAVVTVALIAAASGTAVLAGRRALSTDALRAVREDW